MDALQEACRFLTNHEDHENILEGVEVQPNLPSPYRWPTLCILKALSKRSFSEIDDTNENMYISWNDLLWINLNKGDEADRPVAEYHWFAIIQLILKGIRVCLGHLHWLDVHKHAHGDRDMRVHRAAVLGDSVRADTCADMCLDMCTDMCAQTCVRTRVQTCV